MWSGPRNISTAMMRSFSARGDCEVVDEPLYAHYLHRTGLDHPGRDDVLAAQPTDWREVAATLNADGEQPLRYVKHMAHHLTDDVDRGWLDGWTHAFLLRDPGAMLVSLAKVLPYPPRLVDTGLPQQAELHAAFGGPVVEADALLADPAGELERLCEALGITWTEAMCSWPAGPHPSDGVWADHWYGAVRESTGFGPPRESHAAVPDRLKKVHADAMAIYHALREA